MFTFFLTGILYRVIIFNVVLCVSKKKLSSYIYLKILKLVICNIIPQNTLGLGIVFKIGFWFNNNLPSQYFRALALVKHTIRLYKEYIIPVSMLSLNFKVTGSLTFCQDSGYSGHRCNCCPESPLVESVKVGAVSVNRAHDS